MVHYISGRRLDVPIAAEGSIDAAVIRYIAQVPSNLVLILQRADGTRFAINPQPGVRLNPAECFSDAPMLVCGGPLTT